ncbi:hypothetical protein Trydic_g11228 [Trypoxylus dichotomus]
MNFVVIRQHLWKPLGAQFFITNKAIIQVAHIFVSTVEGAADYQVKCEERGIEGIEDIVTMRSYYWDKQYVCIRKCSNSSQKNCVLIDNSIMTILPTVRHCQLIGISSEPNSDNHATVLAQFNTSQI